MDINIPIIKFDVPNKNGRIYKRENIKLPNDVFCYLGYMGCEVNAASASLELTYTELILKEITFFDNISGSTLKMLVDKFGTDIFIPVGSGVVTDKNEVTNYKLDAISINLKK
jgi:hypothetical protein